MITAIGKLYCYFGVIGIASVVAWVTTAVILVKHARSRRRTHLYWIALGLAVLGLFLAKVNSENVNAIGLDQSDELDDAKKRLIRYETLRAQAEAEEKEEKRKEEEEKRKRKGKKKKKEDEAANGDEPPDIEEERVRASYRGRGKVDRAEGKKRGDKILKQAQEVDEAGQTAARVLKPTDHYRANRLDAMNLFFARWIFRITLLLVVVDWLFRFNKTFNAYFPLPVGCRLMDELFAKTHSVRVDRADREALKDYLERAVRKGETFIYFGDDDLWTGHKLPRLRLRYMAPWFKARVDVALRKLRCLPCWKAFGVIGSWIVEKLARGVDKCRSVKQWSLGRRAWETGLWLWRKCARIPWAKPAHRRLRDLAGRVGSWLREKGHWMADKLRYAWTRWLKPAFQALRRGDDIQLWYLNKIRCASGRTLFDSDFVFESAWFRRYCFVVEGAELSRAWLRELSAFLSMRQTVRASVRQTVNIVWNFEAPIPDHSLKDLLFFCKQTNYKLVHVSQFKGASDVAGEFEESCPEFRKREPSAIESLVEKEGGLMAAGVSLLRRGLGDRFTRFKELVKRGTRAVVSRMKKTRQRWNEKED